MSPLDLDHDSSSFQSIESSSSSEGFPATLEVLDGEGVRRYSTANINHTNNILTRTSTIISNIREDNRFAKTQVEPNPSFDPHDLTKIGTAAEPDRVLSNIASLDQQQQHQHDIEHNAVTNKPEDIILEDTGEFNRFDIENKPPDKGFWAWTAAVCVMCINTFSWGLNACFGVYLNYYITVEYFPGATMEQYVMIGGLGLGLSFMVCSITTALIRRVYYKIIMAIGTALMFMSYFLASISKTITQLIMFQGFLVSIGWALTAGASFVILPTWFLKKRSIAQGIATAGGGLGGLIFARPIDEIIKTYMKKPEYIDNPHEGFRQGMQWALRMEALVCGFMLTISIILIRTYRPLKDNSGSNKPFIIEMFSFLTRFDLLKQVPMLCLIAWNLVYGLAYTILLFSLSSYATSIGLTYKQGSNVTTVQSLAQTVGRPSLGIISDKIGRVNTTIIVTFIVSILAFLFWIFVTTYSQLLAFAFLIGFLLGVNWVNFGPMTADFVGGGGVDMNHAISIQMFTGSLPLYVAELIGLKLRRPEMAKPFLYCQILCGASALVSAIILLPFREWKIKRILTARKKLLEFKVLKINKNKLNEKHGHNDVETEEEEKQHDNDNESSTDVNSIQINMDELNDEVERLDRLLESNAVHYFIRMFYPIAV